MDPGRGPVGSRAAQVPGEEGGLRGSGPSSPPGYTDCHAHELAVAQVEQMAMAAERLDRAYASIERRLDRIAASLDVVERVPISPGQLRMVIGA